MVAKPQAAEDPSGSQSLTAGLEEVEGLTCPRAACERERLVVCNTIHVVGMIVRYRECPVCKDKFKTVEAMAPIRGKKQRKTRRRAQIASNSKMRLGPRSVAN